MAITTQSGTNEAELHLADLAGLVLRMREHLHDKQAAASARQEQLSEAAELMQYWSVALQYSGTEPPKPREVSAKLRWWRRVWREREDLLADQALFSEALPWLERLRDKLIMEDEG
ncbi:MAG: hypothetical protein ACXWQR_04295 [Ktedonobacterales bacterium]